MEDITAQQITLLKKLGDHMSNVTLEQALIIAQDTLKKGKELNFLPLTVAVLDSAGYVKVLLREDQSSLLREEIARGKAWGALDI